MRQAIRLVTLPVLHPAGQVISCAYEEGRDTQPSEEGGYRGGRRHTHERWPLLAVTPIRPLLGSPSEEPHDNPGGSPIVVLMNIGAERGPVVVDIEQTDVEAS